MTKELATIEAPQVVPANQLPAKFQGGLDYSDSETLKVLKMTIAHDATDAEFKMFVEFCKSTGLNPYKKEIWFIKTKEKRFTDKRTGEQVVVPAKVQMMTGINGFYAIANDHPHYDGMEEVEFQYADNAKYPLEAKAKVWRKDRRFPSVGIARWDEYFPGASTGKPGIWETKPFMMLSKVAESIALRKAFPQELNGLYTQEEMPAEYAVANRASTTLEQPSPLLTQPTLEQDEMPEWDDAAELKAVEEAIANEDLVALGAHKILTKGTTHNMTVKDAIKQYRPKIEDNFDKFRKVDQMAIEAYVLGNEGHDIPIKL